MGGFGIWDFGGFREQLLCCFFFFWGGGGGFRVWRGGHCISGQADGQTQPDF